VPGAAARPAVGGTVTVRLAVPASADPAVGRLFRARDGGVYRCESRGRGGYWMVSILNEFDRRSVPRQAVGTAFRAVGDRPATEREHSDDDTDLRLRAGLPPPAR
jgi:hypothetical protein